MTLPSFVGQYPLNNKETGQVESTKEVVMRKHNNVENMFPCVINSLAICGHDETVGRPADITIKGLNHMNFEQYTLPTHWATALMYGDDDSLDDEDLAHLNAFVDAQRFPMFHCIDVEDNESGDFRRYHDATAFGVLACDVSTFTFDVGVV
jgi:hypothetical protein